MNILCLDIGSKRIGIAKSDPLGITAHGVTTIERTTKKRDLEEILNYIEQTRTELLVVGVPLNSEGELGPAAKKILGFINELKDFLKEKGVSIPVETWDESYSTKEAEEELIRFDVSRKKRRKVIDKMAALMILRDYLESKGG